jgi:hypothetical protein
VANDTIVRLVFDSGKVVFVDGGEVDDLAVVLDEYGIDSPIGFCGDDGFEEETDAFYLQPGIYVPEWGEVVDSMTIAG